MPQNLKAKVDVANISISWSPHQRASRISAREKRSSAHIVTGFQGFLFQKRTLKKHKMEYLNH